MSALNASLQDYLYPNIHALLVNQGGVTLHESYYSGEDVCWGEHAGIVNFNSASLHDVRSITKSIIGTLYGVALGEKLVPALNNPIIVTYPEYRTNADYDDITIEHVLNMTAGINWCEDYSYDDPRNDEIAMERAVDRYDYIFTRLRTGPAGVTWRYSGGCSALLGGAISRMSGKPLSRYAEQALFAPLEINDAAWYSGADGVDSAASGLRLTARDLLKVGQLILNNGQYKGTQLVPVSWIEAMLKPRIKTNDDYFCAYGYHWFAGRHYHRDKNTYLTWHAAIGNGGQLLFICPDLRAVVVIFSGEYNNDCVWLYIERLLECYIIPALINGKRRI